MGGKIEDGSKLTGSGIPAGNGNPPPFTLRFTKTGLFRYDCVVHPGMDASIKVVAKGKPIPSAKQDAQATARQLAAQAKLARRLMKFTPPANTTTVVGGNDSGQMAILQFFPSTIHIPVGGTVNFQVTSKTEPHTMTFGPASYLTQQSDNFVIPLPNPQGPPTLVANPLNILPSSQPPLPAYDGTGHGNGFFSTGAFGGAASTLNGGATGTSIKFTTAGMYNYICMIHPEMHGSVIVG
jgi:plastocyanin